MTENPLNSSLDNKKTVLVRCSFDILVDVPEKQPGWQTRIHEYVQNVVWRLGIQLGKFDWGNIKIEKTEDFGVYLQHDVIYEECINYNKPIFDSKYFDGAGDYSARQASSLIGRLRKAFSCISSEDQFEPMRYENKEQYLHAKQNMDEGLEYAKIVAKDVVMALTGKNITID